MTIENNSILFIISYSLGLDLCEDDRGSCSWIINLFVGLDPDSSSSKVKRFHPISDVLGGLHDEIISGSPLFRCPVSIVEFSDVFNPNELLEAGQGFIHEDVLDHLFALTLL